MDTDRRLTSDEVAAARRKIRFDTRALAASVLVLVPSLSFAAAWIAGRFASPGIYQHLATAGLLVLLWIPVMLLSVSHLLKQTLETDAVADARQSRLDAESLHRDLETKVADALEMAASEPEALRVIERGFAEVMPDHPVELLLADNSHAHLIRRASTAPKGATGCQVGSPQECPAARRARVHVFPDSQAINACPKLTDRTEGPLAALCVPVSVMGRTVGVIHSVRERGTEIEASMIQDLQLIANQAGTRLGMLRVMAETQLQASTDTLTGLLNRRAFENQFLALRTSSRDTLAVMVMADLDNFKLLNDTYGHETGDRALRVFSETLRSALRDKDLLCRRGGEEFALLLPECDLPSAEMALERVRSQLEVAVGKAGTPSFTASFGAVPAKLDDDLDTLLAAADAALFEAKRTGRNRVVVHSGSSPERVSSGLIATMLAEREADHADEQVTAVPAHELVPARH